MRAPDDQKPSTEPSPWLENWLVGTGTITQSVLCHTTGTVFSKGYRRKESSSDACTPARVESFTDTLTVTRFGTSSHLFDIKEDTCQKRIHTNNEPGTLRPEGPDPSRVKY